MKKKHFYSHIVDTSLLSLALADMDLSQEERKHLLSLVEVNLHQVIIDLILSELSEEDKKVFLLHLASDHHQKILTLLQKKVDKIEEKIKKASDDIKDQLHKDIVEAKKHH